jgi:hypothetical protein
MSLDDAAGVILHEVSHLLLKHFRRAEKVVGPESQPWQYELISYAEDMAINDALRAEGVTLPKDVVYPESCNLPKGETMEFYYHKLFDRAEKVRPVGGGNGIDGSGDGDGPNIPGDGKGGGSCSDGQPRPWEDDAPGKEGSAADGKAGEGGESDGDGSSPAPGIDDATGDEIIFRTAQKIAEDHKSRGVGAGGMSILVEQVLDPPFDPRRRLMQHVRRATEFSSGTGDYSYRRPNRRNSRPDMVRPSGVQPVPKITVIVDTSGSMGQKDLGLALGLIGKVINGFRNRDGIKVICGDTHAATVGKVFDPKHVKLRGGGGTDMRPLIAAAEAEKPKPDLIIVVTDGYTPWPEKKTKVPLVCCITEVGGFDGVPNWADTVMLAE